MQSISLARYVTDQVEAMSWVGFRENGVGHENFGGLCPRNRPQVLVGSILVNLFTVILKTGKKAPHFKVLYPNFNKGAILRGDSKIIGICTIVGLSLIHI